MTENSGSVPHASLNGQEFLHILGLNAEEYEPVGLVKSGLWGACGLIYSRVTNGFLLVTVDAAEDKVHYSDSHTSVFVVRCGRDEELVTEFRFHWADALDVAQILRQHHQEIVSIQHLDTTTQGQDYIQDRNGFPVIYQSYIHRREGA